MKAYQHIIWGLFIALLLQSCKKDDIVPLFEIESITTIEIPAGLNTVETHYINIRDISSSLQAQLAAQGLSLDDIDVIKPQSFVMTSLDGDTDFSFIFRISSDIFTRAIPDRSEIFFMEPVPINMRNRLSLFPSLLNIKDYMAGPTYNIEVQFNVRGFNPRNVEARIDMIFQAH